MATDKKRKESERYITLIRFFYQWPSVLQTRNFLSAREDLFLTDPSDEWDEIANREVMGLRIQMGYGNPET